MWNKASSLERFVWDYDTMIGEHPRWGALAASGRHDAEISAMLERASKVIKRRLENYGKDKERFGLIHADLRLSNLLVEGNVIKVIDFDDCGFAGISTTWPQP
jgi:Ser/Thr protein kinase RdoA (MazF antagonist)